MGSRAAEGLGHRGRHRGRLEQRPGSQLRPHMGAELDSMKKTNTPKPPQEQFAKMSRDLLRSDAWRSLGINERRVIDFLLIEHMSKGGRENGRLKAPYRQL